MIFLSVLVSVALAAGAARAVETAPADEACGFDRWYVGGAGLLLLPQGGDAVRASAAAAVRGGWYATETLAFEAEGAWAPHAGGEHLFAVSGRGLWHLFGYERFDPFVTAGAFGALGHKPVFSRGRHRSAVGPEAGIGAFYHLTENLSLRCDARAGLRCDAPSGMLYAFSIGLQWSFGDGS